MTIQCQICLSVFEPMSGFQDTNQAYKCSSSTFVRDGNQYLAGYYGSVIADGKTYRVNNRSLEEGSVCDDCIEQMISNRSLTCVSEFNLWGVGE